MAAPNIRERQAAFSMAWLVCRADNPTAYAAKHKLASDSLPLRYVGALYPYRFTECVAQAERLADRDVSKAAGWPTMDQICAKSIYVSYVMGLYVWGEDNVYEAFLAAYKDSHSMMEGESDLSYVQRCAEQDYHDGEQGAAVFQEVYDRLHQ